LTTSAIAWPPGLREEACMNFKRKSAIAACALALGTIPAHAAPTLDEYVTFSGFGTLSEAHSNYSSADFIGTVSQPNGVGYSRRWSPTLDSDLGVQANITLTDALSGVVQVLSRDDADGNFKPAVEWANLKYQITSDLALRLGRIVLPTYDRSDTQNVGYALPWVRVPIEITYTSSATDADGIDVLYRLSTGAVTQNLQLQWGTATQNLPGVAFTSNRAHVALFEDTLQYGDASLHLTYQMCDPLGFPRARLALEDLGFTYDPGAWFATADSNHTQNAYFGDFISGYISGGVRVGRFAPYTFYSSTHALSSGTSGLKSLGDQHTIAAGVRWDFAKNLDFKLQVERVTIDTLDDPAAFSNLQPGVRVGDKADVVSLTLDFVF
jgi:hypothetical protein